MVPVPCASISSTSAVSSPALASAARITRCWEGPLGAVRPLDAPSWLTAEPSTVASTGWPLARASESRSSTTTPAPSPSPNPSAAAAKGLHRPSRARPRWRLKVRNEVGSDITATPALIARSHSPARSAWAAMCSVTSEDEQAVSTVMAGPSRPST